MTDDKRRIKRLSGDVTIWLRLQDTVNENTLAGPTAGRIYNLTSMGAGIRLSQIHIDNYHLFFSSQENADFRLIMEIKHPAETEESFFVPVQPVWFNRVREEDARGNMPFQMGVEFRIDSKDDRIILLKQLFSGKTDSWGSFWRSFKNRISHSFKK